MPNPTGLCACWKDPAQDDKCQTLVKLETQVSVPCVVVFFPQRGQRSTSRNNVDTHHLEDTQPRGTHIIGCSERPLASTPHPVLAIPQTVT